MALDYTLVGISLVVFIVYLITFFFLIEIKKRLAREAGISMVFFMLAILFLTVRRVQQIFIETDIVKSIPYSPDIITLIFAVLFFLGVFYLYRGIRHAGKSSVNMGSSFKEYKRKFGGKIIR